MAHLASVLQEFERAGIECMLLKGAALTLRHYRDFGLRNMGDFDLLIHPHDIERAARLLLQNGWMAEEGCSTEAILSNLASAMPGNSSAAIRRTATFIGARCPDATRRKSLKCSGADRKSSASGATRSRYRAPPISSFTFACTPCMEWTPNLYWVADKNIRSIKNIHLYRRSDASDASNASTLNSISPEASFTSVVSLKIGASEMFSALESLIPAG